MTKQKASRHSSDTIQLSVRVPRVLHQQFYELSLRYGTTGSFMMRKLMNQFVVAALEQLKQNEDASRA